MKKHKEKKCPFGKEIGKDYNFYDDECYFCEYKKDCKNELKCDKYFKKHENDQE